jgi:hypothetical protein
MTQVLRSSMTAIIILCEFFCSSLLEGHGEGIRPRANHTEIWGKSVDDHCHDGRVTEEEGGLLEGVRDGI